MYGISRATVSIYCLKAARSQSAIGKKTQLPPVRPPASQPKMIAPLPLPFVSMSPNPPLASSTPLSPKTQVRFFCCFIMNFDGLFCSSHLMFYFLKALGDQGTPGATPRTALSPNTTIIHLPGPRDSRMTPIAFGGMLDWSPRPDSVAYAHVFSLPSSPSRPVTFTIPSVSCSILIYLCISN